MSESLEAGGLDRISIRPAGIPPALLNQLWQAAECSVTGLGEAEFAVALQHVAAKANFGLPPGAEVSPPQMEAFWRGLHLRELALAQGCALGLETAWQQFLTEYREPLTRAAIAITGSASLGHDLADSLYSELFGLTERDGQRRSPLLSYSGRGSLMGWLRTTLAQRHVDHHRRTHREAPLEREDFAAAEPPPEPQAKTLAKLSASLAATMGALPPEARFVLSSWFLDGRTLLQIARVLGVHEATVSRQLKRLTEKLHKDLLRNLQAGGMSRRGAQEALGTDPRDLSINLRNLLQTSDSSPFQEQAPAKDRGHA